MVRICVGRAVPDYALTLVAADFGRGFLLLKVGHEERYRVNVAANIPTCECRGFLHHAHCKHSDGLAALVTAGRP